MQGKSEFYFYKEVKVNYKGKEILRRQAYAGIIDNNTLRIGMAECSERDQFTKQKGRNIAIGRAKSQKARVVELNKNQLPVKQFIELVK